jgi:uncharacterized protein YjiS (DUF1127 family)
MKVIQSQATYGGWRRIPNRPRRASLLQRALAAVCDWRRRLQDRNRSSALDERTLRDSGICRPVKSPTSTASKSSVTLGLIRCASGPFEPRAASPRRTQ